MHTKRLGTAYKGCAFIAAQDNARRKTIPVGPWTWSEERLTASVLSWAVAEQLDQVSKLTKEINKQKAVVQVRLDFAHLQPGGLGTVELTWYPFAQEGPRKREPQPVVLEHERKPVRARSVPVMLSEELTGSLRLIKVRGALATESLEGFQKRGQYETRQRQRKATKPQRRVKYIDRYRD
jgi:hypothetical protein